MPSCIPEQEPAQYDPGQDGYRITTNAHRDVARDRFGYSLSYNSNDYASIGNKNLKAVAHMSTGITDANLYNGNIRAAVYDYYAANDNEFNGFGIKGIGYTYDQLNRLLSSRHHTYNGSTFTATNQNYTSYTYDANGNIESLQRKDDGGNELDDLEYSYNGSDNRLEVVTELIPDPTAFIGDFEGDAQYNYDCQQ